LKTEPMTLLEAADLVGFGDDGETKLARRKRLMRFLVAREKRDDVQIVERGRPHRVTEAALRKHCPELFPQELELTRLVTERFEVLLERIERAEKKSEEALDEAGTCNAAIRRHILMHKEGRC